MIHPLVEQHYPTPFIMRQYGIKCSAAFKLRQAATQWLDMQGPEIAEVSLAGFVHGWLTCHQNKQAEVK